MVYTTIHLLKTYDATTHTTILTIKQNTINFSMLHQVKASNHFHVLWYIKSHRLMKISPELFPAVISDNAYFNADLCSIRIELDLLHLEELHSFRVETEEAEVVHWVVVDRF